MRSAAEIARVVADAPERDGLPYAIGGAIALGPESDRLLALAEIERDVDRDDS